MKHFILFNSPIFWESKNDNEQYLPPIGLGYIATYLEKAGIDVEIIDCVKGKKSVAEIINIINSTEPDFIGINIFTQNYDIVKYIVESIKIECVCFVGGQVVKSIYQDLLQWDTKTRLNIIIGEGELIIPQIALGNCTQSPEVKTSRKNVYRVNAESTYFPMDISSICLNRKYLDNEVILNHYKEPEAAIITSRGCIYNCAFCGGARSLNSDVPVRIRSEESIISEIQELLSLYPSITSVRVLDDLFLRNIKSIDMANHIFSQFPQISWRGMVHVLSLAGALNKIKELKLGKCRELFIGIESGSDKIRRKINKLGDISSIVNVSKEILHNGIDLKGYFIYGFPGETRDDFQKTYELASTIRQISTNEPGTFRTSVFQFRPYHGTQLYNEIIETIGIIHSCKFNEIISQFEGRSQFNFEFGNYSLEPDNLLNDYIIKTQELTEVKDD